MSKAENVIFHSVFSLFIYAFFASIWTGLLLIDDEGSRIWSAALFAMVGAGQTVWFLVSASRSRNVELRQMDAMASLSGLALFVTFGIAALIPQPLLHTDVLWRFFATVASFLTLVLIVVAILLIIDNFREKTS